MLNASTRELCCNSLVIQGCRVNLNLLLIEFLIIAIKESDTLSTLDLIIKLNNTSFGNWVVFIDL